MGRYFLHEATLTLGSLFSGIGGIEIAAEWAGFMTVFQVEIDSYASAVLKKHWPDVPRWEDIQDVRADDIFRITGTKRGQLTVLSGGFPCQPHSLAGQRKASADDRDLWPEYRRLICNLEPRWVVAENVRGLLSSDDGRFFGGILRDLARLGYDACWCLYRAADVGAVHSRERVFTIAHSISEPVFDVVKRNTIGCWKENEEKRCEDKFAFELSYGEVAPAEWREPGGPSRPLFFGKANGVPNWLDRHRCLGNAVVPHQIYPIFKTIAEIEQNLITRNDSDLIPDKPETYFKVD